MKKIFIIIVTVLLVACNPAEETTTNPYAFDQTYSTNLSQNDLIYSIMIDRFKDSDQKDFDDMIIGDLKTYQGGDLQGVIDQLDYIKSLGTSIIWLTPVAKNEPYGYHGYWIEDFYAVDPHLGNLETLKELVDQAHKKDMKVFLDFIVNHTGYNHPWTKTKEDWYHGFGDLTNDRDQFQLENHRLAGLPDLDTENPEVKAYLFDNALYWIRETGVDGFRLDTVKHVPKDFWNEFQYVIKSEYPQFILLGEVYNKSVSVMESYYQTGIDSLTNFSVYYGIKDTFKLYGDANSLKVAIRNDVKFSQPGHNGIFLDNHDVPRLISSSEDGDLYLKQAMTFVMTYTGVPIIYYGTELGLEGKSDPDNRRMMPWDQVGNEFHDYYLSLVQLRDFMKDYKEVSIIETHKDYIALEYSNGDNKILTLFNISRNDHLLSLDRSNFEDYFTGSKYDLSKPITLKGQSSLVLKSIQ